MFNTWTLIVRDFGKISKADIRVTPFMMFVGENNSGKSYILELLWGIFKNLNFILSELAVDEKFLQLHAEWEAELKKGSADEVDGHPRSIAISAELQSSLIDLLNRSLMNSKEWLVKEIFNHSIDIAHLEIQRDTFFNFTIEVDKSQVVSTQVIKDKESTDEQIVELPKEFLIYRLYLHHDEGLSEDIALFGIEEEQAKEIVPKTLLLRVIETLICRDYSMSYRHSSAASRRRLRGRGGRTRFDPIYFPASRTGFMHTYQTLLGNDRKTMREQLSLEILLDDKDKRSLYGSASGSSLRLTAPVQDFLDKLSELYLDDDQQLKHVQEIEFLNHHIFHGAVTLDQTRNYRFITDELAEGLPLHVTSSLVAELAPLSIFLASQYDPQLFIIEESESHLHVAKQLELVRLFFRLINKGKSIWLTTHSDSFAQQVNNLLTLSQHPKKEALFGELHYEAADTLKEVSCSSCYQFKSVNGKTVVEEMELGAYGFVIPTFNTVLEKLLIETSKIQDFGESHG